MDCSFPREGSRGQVASPWCWLSSNRAESVPQASGKLCTGTRWTRDYVRCALCSHGKVVGTDWWIGGRARKYKERCGNSTWEVRPPLPFVRSSPLVDDLIYFIRFENYVELLRAENTRLSSELQTSTHTHQAEMHRKAQDLEDTKLHYEESMREYSATLMQQHSGIQVTLQDELRRILADKTSVVQAAREEKISLDAHIALLSSK